MATKKTVQAMKATATWTPRDSLSGAIIAACGMLPSDIRIAGGRLRLTAAVLAQHDNMERVAANAEWLAGLKAGLEEVGTIHTWSVTAGAVAKDEVVDLMPPKSAAEGHPDPWAFEQKGGDKAREDAA